MQATRQCNVNVIDVHVGGKLSLQHCNLFFLTGFFFLSFSFQGTGSEITFKRWISADSFDIVTVTVMRPLPKTLSDEDVLATVLPGGDQVPGYLYTYTSTYTHT